MVRGWVVVRRCSFSFLREDFRDILFWFLVGWLCVVLFWIFVNTVRRFFYFFFGYVRCIFVCIFDFFVRFRGLRGG